MKKHYHRNRRLATRSGLADAFYNIVTVGALGGGIFIIWKVWTTNFSSKSLESNFR